MIARRFTQWPRGGLLRGFFKFPEPSPVRLRIPDWQKLRSQHAQPKQ
jgi:hypothetical protein